MYYRPTNVDYIGEYFGVHIRIGIYRKGWGKKRETNLLRCQRANPVDEYDEPVEMSVKKLQLSVSGGLITLAAFIGRKENATDDMSKYVKVAYLLHCLRFMVLVWMV